MEFTGERFVPTEQGQIRIEHYHRYAIVQELVADKAVLDIACGEGYGSFYLASNAKTVVGVDISEEAVKHANSTYKRNNLNYLKGNAAALEFKNDSFDVVISFETIEHLTEQQQMLSEIKRVLRPQGVLIISSPNRPIYSESSGYHNEFHVKELDFIEFDELLKSQFQAIRYFGQRLILGSVIQEIDQEQSALKAWHDDGQNIKPNTGKLDDPVYFLAVCAAKDNYLPAIDSSFVCPTQLDLLKQYIGYADWAKSVENDLELRGKLIQDLQHELKERAEWARGLEQNLTLREDSIIKLQAQCEERTEWALKLQQELQEHAHSVNSLKTQLQENHELIDNQNNTINDKLVVIDKLNQSLAELNKIKEDLYLSFIERSNWAKGLEQDVTKRDQSIIKLQAQCEDRTEWALKLQQDLKTHSELIQKLQTELDDRSLWANTLQQELEHSRALIEGLQTELSDRTAWALSLQSESGKRGEQVQQLQTELNDKTEWAVKLQQDLKTHSELIQKLQTELDDRGLWANTLQQDLEHSRALIEGLQTELSDRTAWAFTLLNETEQSKKLVESFQLAVLNRDEEISLIKAALAQSEHQNQNLKENYAQSEQQLFSLVTSAIDKDHTIEHLQNEITSYKQVIDQLNQLNVEKDANIMQLTDEVVKRGEWGLSLDKEVADYQQQLLAMRRSNSWLITWPMRETVRWITSPIKQINRYGKASLKISKLLYQKLPINYQTKAAHRRLIANHFPKLLLLSGAHESTIPQSLIPIMPETTTDELGDLFAFAERLEIPSSNKPKVSIIIPIYGQIEYTLRCLESIVNNQPKITFEVIVVDDCSPDESLVILKKVRGIKLLRNKKNKGFIRTCNYGAKVAKGEYLYFLNNDTQVLPNWLDALVQTFIDFPGTGLAGSKLIYPDGRLQEAGGIIWQDGSAWNFGRLQDPLLPVYNYAREVDYCSGASIMLPKTLFNKLGGFDEHYIPAYCEDSDLALKIRSKGYRVIYQPMSTVVHYEGVTSGTDLSTGVKAYQVENMNKVFQRWKTTLIEHQPNGVDVDNAKDRGVTRRVLFIDSCTPTPDQDSGSIDSYNQMLLLREMGFQVTFIPEDNFLYMPKYTTALQSIGIEVLYRPYYTTVDMHLNECANRYDLVFLCRPNVAERHIKSIRKLCPKAKILFHTVDLHFLRMLREAELTNDKTKYQSAVEMKQRELALMNAADMTTVLSTEEQKLLAEEISNDKIRLLPYSRSIEGTKVKYQERENIVFVGGYQHTPNVDAVIYFVSEIMPLLRNKLPGVKFYIVGSKVPQEIESLASDDIIVQGFVEDLNPFLDKMRISVAPLRFGAGIKGKVGSAMAVGLPVVATSLAAEGMSLINGENILIADNPEEFLNAIVELYKNQRLWNMLSENSIEFAQNAWGAEAAWKILSEILGDLNFSINEKAYKIELYNSI